MIGTQDIQHLLDNGVVHDESGDKIGKVGQVYLDDHTGEPEWVTVSTGLFGTGESFVPLAGASVTGSELRVPFSKDKVKDAPRVEGDQHLSEQDEAELFAYYGVQDGSRTDGHDTVGDTDTTAPHSRGTTDGVVAGGADGDVTPGAPVGDHDLGADRSVRDDARPVGHDTSGPTTDDAMTLSEEQLDVHTERTQAGTARLRKYVVTENVTTTVPVEREEVRVVREPVTEGDRDAALSGPDLSEEEHEVTLSEERVVVDKETVPVERVRLDKEVVTDEQQVTEDVRHEEVETDVPGAGGTTTGTTDRV